MEQVVVLAIIVNNNDILLVRRKPTEGKLMWQFPGGTVEEGESYEDAIVREVKEETGADIKVECAIGDRVHPYTKKYMVYYACKYLGGEIEVSDDDLDCAEWVGVEKLKDYFTTPLFDKVADYLHKQ